MRHNYWKLALKIFVKLPFIIQERPEAEVKDMSFEFLGHFQ